VHLIALVLRLGNKFVIFVLPFKIGKFAIQLDNSGHNDIDILYQGQTLMEHSGVIKKTRTDTKQSKWLAQVM